MVIHYPFTTATLVLRSKIQPGPAGEPFTHVMLSPMRVLTTFPEVKFLAPTVTAPVVQACRKAVGERQERLYDRSCGHIPPQALPWALIGHCYSLGWPWGAALLSFLHAPPAPSTWAPTRAPPWPATGLRVLHDEFFELRVFLLM